MKIKEVAKQSPVLILTTGAMLFNGNNDSWKFQHGAKAYLRRFYPHLPVRSNKVCDKKSGDITPLDARKIARRCCGSSSNRVLIVFDGNSREQLFGTASIVYWMLKERDLVKKTVVIYGAEFNEETRFVHDFGAASALLAVEAKGVYVIHKGIHRMDPTVTRLFPLDWR